MRKGTARRSRNWPNNLKEFEAELRLAQEDLAKQLEPLLSRREVLRTKIELVQKLIAMEGEPSSVNHGTAPIQATAGAELQNAVKEILEERREPMHISDIRAALLSRGIPIPGKGTDANIIVHLRRAPQVFVKRGRGTYALKIKAGTQAIG